MLFTERLQLSLLSDHFKQLLLQPSALHTRKLKLRGATSKCWYGHVAVTGRVALEAKLRDSWPFVSLHCPYSWPRGEVCCFVRRHRP